MEESKTWSDINYFDDIVQQKERDIISKLEAESGNRCPYLRKEGAWFYYCGIGASPDEAESWRKEEISPDNPIYQRHVSVVEMELYCMDRFENCGYYSGSL